MTSLGAVRAWSRIVVPPLLVARVLWLAVFLAVLAVNHPGLATLPGLSSSLLHWDALAYIDIAQSGYPPQLDYRDAFLPGYPLLVHAVAGAVRDHVLSGWLVNLAGEAVALVYIARLVRLERSRSDATFAVWLVALAPTALFLTATFTESPFIAAAAASLYYARSGRPLAAAVSAALACAVRLTGLALIPALALETLSRSRWRPTPTLLLLVVVPLPLAAYCAYMQAHTGDALALVHAEQLPSFGQALTAPWDAFITTWNTMATATDGDVRSVFAREVAFGLLGLLACLGMWASTRIPASLALYCSIAWLMTASVSFWRSEPRYLLALFPVVLLACDLTSRARAVRPVLVAASAALMCAGTWIFAEGRWLG